ncbi:MAG: potassium channel protein [Phycisphaerae bacterium]|nr:potassium channel protein [Phycisphaerae bacterium]
MFFQSDYTWLDSLYMTIITISTVGLREVGGSLSDAGRWWTIFTIVGGLTLMTILGSQIAAFVVEGQVRGVIRRRQLEKQIASLSGHVIICGFGRMGSQIVQNISDTGRDIVVIDKDSERIAMAERAGLLCVQGDAQEDETLEAAGVSRATVLYATLSSDAANLFVTLSVKQDNPKVLVITRAQDESSLSKLKRAGADRVICPQVLGANRMSDVLLRPAMVDLVEMAHDGVGVEMDQLLITDGSTLVGKTLQGLELPKKCGAHVIAIRHSTGQTSYHPDPEHQLQLGDLLILVGRPGAIETLQTMQRG